jgi:hypothetical protein
VPHPVSDGDPSGASKRKIARSDAAALTTEQLVALKDYLSSLVEQRQDLVLQQLAMHGLQLMNYARLVGTIGLCSLFQIIG